MKGFEPLLYGDMKKGVLSRRADATIFRHRLFIPDGQWSITIMPIGMFGLHPIALEYRSGQVAMRSMRVEDATNRNSAVGDLARKW